MVWSAWSHRNIGLGLAYGVNPESPGWVVGSWCVDSERMRGDPASVSLGATAVSFSGAAVSREMLGGEQEGMGRRRPAGHGSVLGAPAPRTHLGEEGSYRTSHSERPPCPLTPSRHFLSSLGGVL